MRTCTRRETVYSYRSDDPRHPSSEKTKSGTRGERSYPWKMTVFAPAPRPSVVDDTNVFGSAAEYTKTQELVTTTKVTSKARSGRPHRLKARAKAAPKPTVQDKENAPAMSKFAMFAPRPPSKPRATTPPALSSETCENERQVLIRAVREAVDAKGQGSLPHRDTGRRVFANAFDGNRPRTPPLRSEKNTTRMRQKQQLAQRPARGVDGGGGEVLLATHNETQSNQKEVTPNTEPVWAPGSSSVRAWTADAADASRDENASPDTKKTTSPSTLRPMNSSVINSSKLSRAIDALRGTAKGQRGKSRRAWSADASPYAASLTGTLPPANGAKPRKMKNNPNNAWTVFKPSEVVTNCSLAGKGADVQHSPDDRRSQSARFHKLAFSSVTPPKTLWQRIKKVTEEKELLEGKCVLVETARDTVTTERDCLLDQNAAQELEINQLKKAMEDLRYTHALRDASRLVEVSEALEGQALRQSNSRRRSVGAGASPTQTPPRASLLSSPTNNNTWSPPLVTSSASPVEDSPPSRMWAQLMGFNVETQRELDAVPSWPPSQQDTGSPTLASTNEKSPTNIPPIGQMGVPSGFEMGGGLSDDEDGESFPPELCMGKQSEPETPPMSKTAAFENGMATDTMALTPTANETPLGVTPSGATDAKQKPCSHCVIVETQLSSLQASLQSAEEFAAKLRRDCQVLELEVAEARDEAGEHLVTLNFERLDTDKDGYLTLDDLLRAEVFASYAQHTVERIWEQWVYGVGRKGDARNGNKRKGLDPDEFKQLCLFTANRNVTPQSLRFWWRVVDVDGDGVLGKHDIKQMYECVWKDPSVGCVSCEDLTTQIFDMAGCGEDGISFSSLKKSKLANGIIGILCNHDDMLLRRSTAEFSEGNNVPM